MSARIPQAACCRTLLFFSGVVAWSSACGPSSPPSQVPRLVVLYAPCTVQKNQLAPYSPEVAFTPNLAAFARESLVFERHTTEAAQSGPAFAALFSGTHADRHGVYHHPKRLDPELYLVSEAFADKGFETWFWSGHTLANAALDYGQGVLPERVREHFDVQVGLQAGEALGLTANEAEFDRLLERLAANPDLRAFVQVNFTITHGPYSEYCSPEAIAAFCREFPAECAGLDQQQIARYLELYEEHYHPMQWDFDELMRVLDLSEQEQVELAGAIEVAYKTTIHELDRLFGMFVERIRASGLWDESLIAFTADHGEVFQRDNAMFRWTHALLGPEELDVPLILRVPGPAPPPGRYAQVTRSIDVFPTLAGLCAIVLPEEKGVEGVDLSAAVRGTAPAPELLAYSHTCTFSRQLARQKAFPLFVRHFGDGGVDHIWFRVRSHDLVCKLRNLDGTGFGFEVFDLATDPEERRNLYEPGNAQHAELGALLNEYRTRLIDAHGRRSDRRPLTDESELQLLRSLGYAK